MKNKLAIKYDSSNEEFSTVNQCVERILARLLGKDELQLLLKYSQLFSFREHDLILKQGEKIDGIYIIIEGSVIVSTIIMGKGAARLETLVPGQFFSAISFFENGPCLTSFLATEEVVCLFIPNNYFQWISVDFPKTKYKIIQVIAEQIGFRLKTIHDVVSDVISESNMTSLSFFDRIVYSINQPRKIPFEESGISKNLIQKMSIFNPFSADEMDVILDYLALLDAPVNCKLLSEGDKTASCYLVIYGAIQSCIIQDAKLAKLSVIGPGILLASMGCIEDTSLFNITYITCEPTIFLKFSDADLQFLKQNHPELWYKLFELICGSITALKKSIDKLNIRFDTEIYNR